MSDFIGTVVCILYKTINFLCLSSNPNQLAFNNLVVLSVVLEQFQQLTSKRRPDVANLRCNLDFKQNLKVILAHKQTIFGNQKSIETMNAKTDIKKTDVAIASSSGDSANALRPDLDSNTQRNILILQRMAVSEK